MCLNSPNKILLAFLLGGFENSWEKKPPKSDFPLHPAHLGDLKENKLLASQSVEIHDLYLSNFQVISTLFYRCNDIFACGNSFFLPMHLLDKIPDERGKNQLNSPISLV